MLVLSCPTAVTDAEYPWYLEAQMNNSYTDDVAQRTYLTDANDQFIRDPNISRRFKSLICRCMAQEDYDMPTLREVLDLCEAYANGTAVDEDAVERDDVVEDVVWQVFFDAPVPVTDVSDL